MELPWGEWMVGVGETSDCALETRIIQQFGKGKI